MAALTLANYPYDIPGKHDPEVMKKIGVLIPCHKSADEIERTLISILDNHIPPRKLSLKTINKKSKNSLFFCFCYNPAKKSRND